MIIYILKTVHGVCQRNVRTSSLITTCLVCRQLWPITLFRFVVLFRYPYYPYLDFSPYFDYLELLFYAILLFIFRFIKAEI